MQATHKIEIDANNKQRTYFIKACGVSRFVYNWALGEWNRQYKEGIKTNGLKLKKEFNSIKKEKYPWTREVTKYAAQQPFIHLNLSFSAFFKKQSKYPKFKKKGKTKDSFYIGGDQTRIIDNLLHIPNLGKVRLKEKPRYKGKINSVTVSRHADHWFASVQYDNPEKISSQKTNIKNISTVGIDLGINKALTLSDGLSFDAPKPLKLNLRKLKRLQRKLTKKNIGSRNRAKQKRKIARLHYRISCMRKDVLHKLTSYVSKNYSKIGVENLNVKGMLKNHKLARAISEIGFFEIKRQLSYKSTWYGKEIKEFDRFYPSSKKCSSCGHKKEELTLKERVYHCQKCNLKIDRDLNASINLDPIPRAPRKFTPVEITAIQKLVSPVLVTSIE